MLYRCPRLTSSLARLFPTQMREPKERNRRGWGTAFVATLLWLGGVSLPAQKVTVLNHGVFDCFQEGLEYDGGASVQCEASAVEALNGGRLLVVTDKPVPGLDRSQVLEAAVSKVGSEVTVRRVGYRLAEEFIDVRKLEALSATGSRMFAMSSFSWPPEPGETKQHPYNTFLWWDEESPGEIHVAYESVASDKTVSSLRMRPKFSDPLELRSPYFKIEGLASLPRQRLVFGIREVGSYGAPEYVAKLLVGRYAVKDDKFKFFRRRLKSVDLTEAIHRVQPEAGISALAFHPERKELWIVTSFEPKETTDESEDRPRSCRRCSARLWTMPIRAARKGRVEALSPVTLSDGRPLVLPYKTEGITFLDSGTILVVHDDDRAEDTEVEIPGGSVTRQPHQAVFSALRIED